MIYLASPYNHEKQVIRDLRFHAVRAEVWEMMSKEGLLVYSPIAYGHQFAKEFLFAEARWEFWKKFDLAMIGRCDEVHVLMLPGWDISVGVKAEIDYADSINKKVRFRSPVIRPEGLFGKRKGFFS